MKRSVDAMPGVKTAISLQRPLFEQAEMLAHELRVSRSRLFVLALEDFIRRRQSQRLFERINAAHEEAPPPSENTLRRRMRRRHRRMVEGEW